VSEKSPWWQMSKTVWQGVWLGCGYVILGVLKFVFPGKAHVTLPIVIIGAGFLTLGLGHLVSVVAMRRRQRSSLAREGRPAARDSTPPTF
jgi:protein-S-isoprenylcysteine O-methyltransferase Ste14